MPTPDAVVAVRGGESRSVALSRTFGEETSPSAWRSFKDHYLLVKEANIARGVALWQDPAYRSVELRLCLVGAPAEFLREEAAQGSPWVKDDEGILNRLERRYVTTEAIEVRILRFEEANQGQGESLADFLTRLQRLAGDAFASESSDIKRKRVVWRFLDGLVDRDIRERLIHERWMKDEANAKEYDEIIKIAETARAAKQAASLTGHRHQVGGACAAGAWLREGSVASPPLSSGDCETRGHGGAVTATSTGPPLPSRGARGTGYQQRSAPAQPARQREVQECGYWVQPVRATIRPPSSSTGVGDQHRGGAGSSAVTNRRGG
ncbi:uncharacterized protein LOC122367597 isoform X3 [Amphibalanus amphitrite]|uniref:uncharacterized protein LOC122367597 isoform X3 n=1 Tax=Amphibalanus amphitrite TaxID=1232801 RepID=UPI001C91F7E2|nr:uncharacterized protein LOC122367597 isoform X3 [Amphibalanus amphitrite]XP_043196794.1 uncharacterized protein LOC122367597 isoform X3 [Amphibalanus amphitrite]